MKFDTPGLAKPTKVIRYREYREYVFDMPYETDDPVEIAILSADPLVAEVKSKPIPAPVVEPVKPSRKEV